MARPELLLPQPARELGEVRVALAPPERRDLPGAAVYENVAEFDPDFAAHYRRDIYAPRRAELDGIDLVELGRAVLHPAADHLLLVGGRAVSEQVAPWHDLGRPLPPAAAQPRPQEEVVADTVVIARYGAGTWGHWLGELLPKLVLVEAAFPGRFHFAVPADHAGVEPTGGFQQSLTAAGVPRERLVPLTVERSYLLRRAWAVTPVWSDHVMHPVASRSLRARLDRGDRAAGAARRLAVVRRPDDARSLLNQEQVLDVLQRRGFEVCDVAALPFAEQVVAFREARTVFSVLGSGLTGVLFAREGVQVLSAAPSLFGDRFFYALVLDRDGRYADVRGPVSVADRQVAHRSAFSVDVARLEEGLDALAADRPD